MQGVVFDFNGTLFWDTKINERVWRRFALKHAGREVTDEEFVALHGVPNEQTIEYLLGRAVAPDEGRVLSAEKEAYYYEACLADPGGMRLAPGARQMLDDMARLGVARAIATSANLENVNFYFKHLDLGRWFRREHVVYSDGTRAGKPAPDCFWEAARRLNLSPSRLAAVEDSDAGMRAAYAAGFARLVGVDAGHSRFASIPGVRIIRDFCGWRDWFDGDE